MPENKETDEEKPIVAKSAIDLQRLKLQKLMKNPEKPVVLPERPKTKNTPTVPEFVRNVMGSSAGAGSGEFHVYRHLRRKEYARQKFIQEIGRKELLDAEYHKKLEENKKVADEITAKKRAKRLKKKQKWKQKKRIKVANVDQHKKNEDSDSEQSSSEQETDEKNDNEDESVTTNETKDNEVENNETVQTSALSTNKSIDEKSMNQSDELQLQDDCDIKNDDSEIVNNSEVSNNENDR